MSDSSPSDTAVGNDTAAANDPAVIISDARGSAAVRATIEVLADESPPAVPGAWLRHRRPQMRTRYADGTTSAPYVYENVERHATDAVVLALYHDDRVLLRTAMRPPISFRSALNVPLKGPPGSPDALDDCPVLWELPAGLIEPSETGLAGIAACAIREAEEETGYHIATSALEPLGPPSFLSPGVIAEQLHFFAAAVVPGEAGPVFGDGSPVEDHADIRFVPFAEALSLTRDAKSELGILRLMSKLGVHAAWTSS